MVLVLVTNSECSFARKACKEHQALILHWPLIIIAFLTASTPLWLSHLSPSLFERFVLLTKVNPITCAKG
jgi:hypothetical protein